MLMSNLVPRVSGSALAAATSSADGQTFRLGLGAIATTGVAFTGSKASASRNGYHDTESSLNRDGPDTPVPADSWTTWRRDEAVRLRMAASGPAAEKPLSVMTFFRNTVEKVPNRAALASKVNGSWTFQTYEQYYDNVRRAARGFIELGLDRYSSVGIMGFNSAEWHLSCLGAIFAGGFATGIYGTNSPEACRHVAEHARCDIIVVDDDKQLDKILSIRSQLQHLKAIVQYRGQPKERRSGVLSWEELMEIGSKSTENELELRINAQSPNKGCMLVYTSGTTGDPKGVMISHDNITWTSRRVQERVGYSIENETRIVSFLPLSHVAAQVGDIYGPMSFGGTIYFAQPDALKKFTLDIRQHVTSVRHVPVAVLYKRKGSLVETLKEVQPTQMLGVPRVYEKMHQAIDAASMSHSYVKRKIMSWAREAGTKAILARMSGQQPSAVSRLADRLVLSKIRQAIGLSKTNFCVSAAAPISRSTLNFFASINLPVVEVFGMSETSGPHTFGDADDNQIGSVGRELDGAETILNDQNEEGAGEMLFNGRNVCMGYLDNEKLTKEAFGGPSGKYLKSGDLARRDTHGFLHIAGRIKELIITAGGENVASVDVENAVKERLPNIVSNAVLVGDGKKYLSMLITLCTEIDPETLSSLDQLTPNAIEWCKAYGSTATRASDVINDEKLHQVIQRAIREVNRSAISRAQKIRRWTLLPKDFSIGGGELGPTLKVRRHVVLRKYENVIESMYDEQPITEHQSSSTSIASVVLQNRP